MDITTFIVSVAVPVGTVLLALIIQARLSASRASFHTISYWPIMASPHSSPGYTYGAPFDVVLFAARHPGPYCRTRS
jgi:hypothetical protein